MQTLQACEETWYLLRHPFEKHLDWAKYKSESLSNLHYNDFNLTLLEVKVVGSNAWNQITLIAHGAQVTLGAIKHREVAAIVVCAVDVVEIKDTHCSAGVLVHIGALVHPVDKFVPLAGGEFTGCNLVVGEFISCLGSNESWNWPRKWLWGTLRKELNI